MANEDTLSVEETNVVRVLAAIALAVNIASTVALYRLSDPVGRFIAFAVAFFIGLPTLIVNIAVWRSRLHW